MKSTYCFLGLVLVTLWNGYGQSDQTGCMSTRFYYYDADGDGYGSSDYTEQEKEYVLFFYNQIPEIVFFEENYSVGYGCNPSIEWVTNDDDFDDSNPLITNILPRYFYYDGDGDGFGNPAISVFQSHSPSGYVIKNTDCDDTDAAIHPNNVWYEDADGDGMGSSHIQQSCLQPEGYVPVTGDVCPNDP
ncbi:MAG: hypothetical protein ACPH63_03440, partial [Flavobacteriaceae bacterium]